MATRSSVSSFRQQNEAAATSSNEFHTGMNTLSLESDINILLLGQTGVGKTTFINSFANYLVHSSLDAAIKGEMVLLIPTAFFVSNPRTYQSTKIEVGTKCSNEQNEQPGESSTQGCRSYTFTFGNRKLRLIDAPGIGDVRGVTQDARNFEHILEYISQYDHLNGICILLKPNEDRLNTLFKFCINELLTHLHISAKENIIFVFTNSRATFFTPGGTVTVLRAFIDDLRKARHVDVPFSSDNTFCFDNEGFRFLATCKYGIRYTPEQIQGFGKSWDFSAKEFIRLFARIINCKPHGVQDTLSINEARQIIRKLGRPLGEVARIIVENLDLAKRHEQAVQNDSPYELDEIPAMPQKSARFVPLDIPCTVCTSDHCTQVKMVDGRIKVHYTTKCHKNCRLRSVEQETLNSPALLLCSSFDRSTGKRRS